jgi:pyrroline-5-carboxylate reductase
LPESQQNDLAAVSGSGPAYLFYLAENMIRGAQELGLDSELAQSLVRQTLVGAAELLAGSSASPEQLRQQVTSPGGMTAAAMEVLEVREVGPAVIDALARGTESARELGG